MFVSAFVSFLFGRDVRSLRIKESVTAITRKKEEKERKGESQAAR